MTPLTTGQAEEKHLRALLRRAEWAVLGFLLLCALGAYFTIQRVIVHGRSMEPTFHSGDALVAWKLLGRDSLHVGDVIVFRDADGAELIKRVVFLQNAQGTETPPQFIQTPGGLQRFAALFHEYDAAVAARRLPAPAREQTIYVMGDNTDNSEDSRVWGPIRPDQVIGRVSAPDLVTR